MNNVEETLQRRFPDTCDPVVQLRMEAYSSVSGFRTTSAAREKMRRYITAGIASAWSNGALYGWHDATQHRCHLYWWHEAYGFHGSPVQQIVLDWLPGDSAAEACALQALQDVLLEFGEHAEIQLLPHQYQATELLLKNGFSVLGEVLLGECHTALERLERRYSPSGTLDHLGLRLERARPEDTEAILALQVEVFTLEPWACWFGASEQYLNSIVRPMLDGRREAINYCIWEQDRLVGALGADIERDNAYWGPIAGLDLVLHPDIQGRGVIKTGYRRLLRDLSDAGIQRFKGGTLQPAVQGLGQVMGRQRISTHLQRRSAPQPPGE